MHAYLVDYENVGKEGLIGIDELEADDYVKIFYSKNAEKITEGVREDFLASKACIEGQLVTITHKNALDFQLSTDLGRLSKEEHYDRISIISRDQGFQSVVAFMKQAERETITDQYSVIIEARMAEVKNFQPKDISRREKKVHLEDVLTEMSRYRKFDEQLRGSIPDLSEDEIETIRSIYLGTDARTQIYCSMLKNFGRDKGLKIYRFEQEEELSRRFLKGDQL